MRKNIFKYIIILINIIAILFIIFQIYRLYLDKYSLEMYLSELSQKTGIRNLNNFGDIIIIRDNIIRDIYTKNREMVVKRPKIGYNVYDIITYRQGLCGEGARLLYHILRYYGIESRRIYLYGFNAKHVILEVFFDNEWRTLESINGFGDSFKALLDTNIFDIKELLMYSDKYKLIYFNNYSYIPFNYLTDNFLINTEIFVHKPLPKLFNYILESPPLIYIFLSSGFLFLINLKFIIKLSAFIIKKVLNIGRIQYIN